MKMFYDPEIDALYIRFADDVPADSLDFSEGVTAEVDVSGHVIALEILDLHEHLAIAEDALKAATSTTTSAA